MQLASSTQLPDGPLASTLLLSQKPRHGLPSRKPAPHQPIDERNCTAALGLGASLLGNAVRPTEHDGSYDASNPQSFNRYAYVLNNPLSYIDPSGLDDNCVVNDDGSVTCSGDPGSGDPCATNTSVCVSGGGGGGNYPCLDYLTYYNCGGNNGNSGGGTVYGGGGVGGALPSYYLGPPHLAILSKPQNQQKARQQQPNPSHCQGLGLAALAYGAGVAKDAANDLAEETADFYKAAAPFVGAVTFRIISSLGEPTLGLLAGAAVDSGVAEGAGAVLVIYLGYKGATAAVGFYQDQNAKCP